MGQNSVKLSKPQLEELQQTTNFTKDELQEWFEVFQENYPEGRMSREQFVTENVAAHGGDDSLWDHIFDNLDENKDGAITFNEFIQSMSHGSRGDASDKLRWIFKFYDKDKSGYIEYPEMLAIFESIFKLVEAVDIDHLPPDQNTPQKRCQSLFEKMDTDGDGRLCIQEFIDGCKRDPTIMQIMELKR
eukprot:NODE_7154_length_788_cov_106.600000_g6915_i0.p1 GENE.NODE_7154_length_788_cov_106.600000_g6915_i0~~NODE_7154_length_788_cov_106.600000_g6915_i0.p1  ORF type:complete len:188 (-),score=46.22 NODE_7154_length_788_cov_106.600000_g6915_i0:168-731(-)